MKIHIAGFNFDWTKKGTLSTPYHGGICARGVQQWETTKIDSDELALIVSLREDLHRFSGRRM